MAACRGLDPLALLGLCLRVHVLWGLWVHSWICSRQGLWACCSSSLGLLHCGCWVVPLRLSSALLLLWEGCGSPVGGSLGFPCSGGPLGVMFVAQISSVSVSGPGG
ncbi:hypothetical protein AMECASPLE_028896 [Ameca splendens]|uniref:Secreted protein n=1 Tax=Ameca splendens TaxID=208324 RepID=A0ABV0YGZ6_9TELE